MIRVAAATTYWAMTVVAQEAVPDDLPSLVTFVNYGVMGLWLFLLVLKPKLHTASEVSGLHETIAHERAARAKAEAEAHRLHILVEEQVIPALARSTDLIARQLNRGNK